MLVVIKRGKGVHEKVFKLSLGVNFHSTSLNNSTNSTLTLTFCCPGCPDITKTCRVITGDPKKGY